MNTQAPKRVIEYEPNEIMTAKKIYNWSDVCEAILNFSRPYDDGDIDPDGVYEITRHKDGSSSLAMTLEWPPKKIRGKKNKPIGRRLR